MNSDLWPEDLTEDLDKLVTPISILRKQGELLGSKTRNLVEGKIHRLQDNWIEDSTDKFQFIFSIEAPTLTYSYNLLKVSYDITFYPIELEVEETKSIVKTEAEFIAFLKATFSLPKTKRIIRALLALLEFRPSLNRNTTENDIPF